MSSKSSKYKSAQVIQTAAGRQYHIGLKQGDVTPYILLCGDVGRVDKIAKHLKNARSPIKNREYITITGTYKGIPITAMATGMGPDNTEMAVVELSHIVENPTLIRVGTSGGVHPKVDMGDLVISSGALRMENTSTCFVDEGFPAVAHYEVVAALVKAAQQQEMPFHVGITATTSSFYGGQGRQATMFKSKNPGMADQLASQNVLNFEMEASCLFTLAALAGYRAGAVCLVLNNRKMDTWIPDAMMGPREEACILSGLEAMVIIAQRDKQKGK